METSWYLLEYDDTAIKIYINITYLTNEKLDNLLNNNISFEHLPTINININTEYNDTNIIIEGVNNELNINKLLEYITSKITPICYLKLEITNNNNTKIIIPKNVLHLYTYNFNVNFLSSLSILKKLEIGNLEQPLDLPDNIPNTVEEIHISALYLTPSFYNLPSSVTNLTIQITYINMNITLWPIHLKTLMIIILLNDHKSIGILPHGLINFIFIPNTYDYKLVLPSTLKILHYTSINSYKYNFDDLSDNIETLVLNYTACHNISRLPISCKYFRYIETPNNIKCDILSKFPSVNISFE